MEGKKEVQEGGDIVYLRMIHVGVWQKPIQHCRAIILQLKINIFFLKRKCPFSEGILVGTSCDHSPGPSDEKA